MKKLGVLLLAVVMILLLCACQNEESVTVIRSFIAGYSSATEGDDAISGERVLVNLLSDGTVDFYLGQLKDGVHTMTQYEGTYRLGENEEFDETISICYSYGEQDSAEIEDVVIIDGVFEMPFVFMDGKSESSIRFYETAPVLTDGDIYVGYMTKVSGMGPMVYTYALSLKENGTFDVSIMQMASVMHVWGSTNGTYVAEGENITFIYDILTSEGEVVLEDAIAEGSEYSDVALKTAFNIQQESMRASTAPFIKVN